MKKGCNTKLSDLVPEGSGNQRKTKTRGGVINTEEMRCSAPKTN